MNSFNIKPDIEFNQDDIEKPFLLKEEVIYQSNKYYGYAYDIKIEENYTWNGANIPKWLWSIIGLAPTDPKVAEASMVHDKLCENKNLIIKCGVGTSSQIFRDILVKKGVGKNLADIVMRGVWIFQIFQKGWTK